MGWLKKTFRGGMMMLKKKQGLGIWLLITIIMVTGCGNTPKELEKSSQTEATGKVLFDETLITNNVFTLDTLSDEGMVELLYADTYDDLIGASPFYVSDLFKNQFEDVTYFDERALLISKIMIDRQQMMSQAIALLESLDLFQNQVLDAYAREAEKDTSLKAYYEEQLETYSDELLYLTLIESQIEALETSEATDAYTVAWEDYFRLIKSNDFVTRELAFLARLAQDAVLLNDTLPQTGHLDDLLNSMMAYDEQIGDMLSVYKTIQSDLIALEKADAYATLSLMIYLHDVNMTLEEPLKRWSTETDASDDLVGLALESNRYMIEATGIMGAYLIDLYQLDLKYAEGEDKAAYLKGDLVPAVLMAASTKEVSASSAIDDAKETLSSAKAKKLNKPKGFFSTVIDAVRRVPGILIEKTSNAVYKTALDYYEEDYELEKGTFDEEKKRADQQTFERIQNATAGSETLNHATKMIEAVEDSVGNLSDSLLGKENTLSKVIKASSKFTAGCFTGASKSLIKLLDPTATPGEMAKAGLDVGLTVVGGSKTAEKLFNTGNSVVTKFLGKKIDTVKNFAVGTTKSLLGKTKTFFSSATNAVGSFFGIAKSSTQKLSNTIVSTGKTFVKATTKVVEVGKKLFTSSVDKGKKVYQKLTGKLGKVAQKGIESESIIGNVIGDNASDIFEAYVVGSVYDEIPNFVDKVIPEFFSSVSDTFTENQEDTHTTEGDTETGLGVKSDTSETDQIETEGNHSSDREEDQNTTDGAANSLDSVNQDNEEKMDATKNETQVVENENSANDMTDADKEIDVSTAEEEDTSVVDETTEEEGQIQAEPTEHEALDNSQYYGTYQGAYKPASIAGMSFDLNASNSSVTLTLSETQVVMESYIKDPMLDGSGITYRFDTYSISDTGAMELAYRDDEGDKQVFNIQFLSGHKLTGSITLYDGSTAFGTLNFYAE